MENYGEVIYSWKPVLYDEISRNGDFPAKHYIYKIGRGTILCINHYVAKKISDGKICEAPVTFLYKEFIIQK